MQEKAYTESDIFANFTATNKSMRVKSTYLNRFDAFVQFIEVDIGMTKNSFMRTSLNVHLNNNLSYYIFIMDTKLQFLSENALPFIRLTFLKLSKNFKLRSEENLDSQP